MSASATTPMSSVPTRAKTCRLRRRTFMTPGFRSKGLTDAEMEAESPRLGLAVHEQSVNRIELIAEVGADRSDRRVVTQSRTGVVAHVVQVEVPGVGPDIPAVDEQHRAEIAP